MSLKDEGFLFIQVNDTRLNPFEVLVADHLTHFEPGTLSKMIEKAGFKVVSVDNNWVTKEISMLAKKTTLRSEKYKISSNHDEDKVMKQILWLKKLRDKGMDLSSSKKSKYICQRLHQLGFLKK